MIVIVNYCQIIVKLLLSLLFVSRIGYYQLCWCVVEQNMSQSECGICCPRSCVDNEEQATRLLTIPFLFIPNVGILVSRPLVTPSTEG
jgi:hypothetical protein